MILPRKESRVDAEFVGAVDEAVKPKFGVWHLFYQFYVPDPNLVGV
jgi:hypothetical protein